MTVVGLSVLRKKSKDALAKTDEALAAAIYQKGLQIIGRAVIRTPVEFGVLRRSNYVAPPRGKDHEVELGFGTDYAIPVHERVEAFHETGGPLFLKRSMDEAMGNYSSSIAKLARRNFEKGVGVKSVSATAPKKPNPPG